MNQCVGLLEDNLKIDYFLESWSLLPLSDEPLGSSSVFWEVVGEEMLMKVTHKWRPLIETQQVVNQKTERSSP